MGEYKEPAAAPKQYNITAYRNTQQVAASPEPVNENVVTNAANEMTYTFTVELYSENNKVMPNVTIEDRGEHVTGVFAVVGDTEIHIEEA